MNRVLAAILAASTALVPLVARSTPVSYDETISGDLDGAGFVFDTGANTFRGQFRGVVIQQADGTIQFDYDYDFFSFSIPVGKALISATVQGQFTELGATLNWSPQFLLTDSTVTGDFPVLPNAITCVPVFGPPNCLLTPVSLDGTLFEGAFPVLLGEYRFRMGGGASGGFLPVIGGSFEYVLTLNVANVPEPDSAFIAILALLGMVVARRPKTSAA